MNAPDLIELIALKSVVLHGGVAEERAALLSSAAAAMEKDPTYAVYQLPEHIKGFERYVRAMARVFPVRSPDGSPPEGMGIDQLWDMHLDWTPRSKTTVVFLPEVHAFYRKHRGELLQILSDYLTRSVGLQTKGKGRFRFVLSSKVALKGVPDELIVNVGHRDLPLDWEPQVDIGKLKYEYIESIDLAIGVRES